MLAQGSHQRDIDFCDRSTEGKKYPTEEEAIHIHRISKRYSLSDVLELTGFILMHTPL